MTSPRQVLATIGAETSYAQMQAATGATRMHLRTVCGTLRNRGFIERVNPPGPMVEAIFRITDAGRAQLRIDSDRLSMPESNQPIVQGAIDKRPALAICWPAISDEQVRGADSTMGVLA